MVTKFCKKISGVLAGMVLGITMVGFAGLVAANSFSGPSNEPPNGFISPVFDGLTVNGRLDVSDTSGTSFIKGLTVRDFVADNIQGCIGCSETQTIDINSAYVDMRGVTELEIGSGSASYEVDINSHLKARSIGYMYEVTGSKSLTDSSLGTYHTTYATCPSTTYLVSCTSRLYDYYMDYKHDGSYTYASNNSCYGYARQAQDPAQNGTLYVKAMCWDPDNLYNKNF